jgi:hypothetical protein
MTGETMKIEQVSIETLIPYARNARTHTDEQIAAIAASIREFGFNTPVLIDAENGIIAGHGRVMAARKLALEAVPCVRLDHLSDTQRRAYILADNQLALKGAGWDLDLLSLEIDDLLERHFDVDLTGFSEDDLASLRGDLDVAAKGSLDDTYSRKIEAPIYEPKGERPAVSELSDDSKARELRAEIDAAEIPEDVKGFLRAAADRHTVFHFRRIAEFYAHASADVQHLMERSALVIIDFDSAIQNGFVALTERLGQIADMEGWNEHDA